MSEDEFDAIAAADIAYGVAGTLVLATGVLRASQYGKGWEFYAHEVASRAARRRHGTVPLAIDASGSPRRAWRRVWLVRRVLTMRGRRGWPSLLLRCVVCSSTRRAIAGAGAGAARDGTGEPVFWLKIFLFSVMGAASFFPTTKIIQRAVAKKRAEDAEDDERLAPFSPALVARMTSVINAEASTPRATRARA